MPGAWRGGRGEPRGSAPRPRAGGCRAARRRSRRAQFRAAGALSQGQCVQRGAGLCSYFPSMGCSLEIASEVREYLLPPEVVEAMQAAERKDELCPVCKAPVSDEVSLLVWQHWAQYKLALSHRACRASQLARIEKSQFEEMTPYTFALGWHAILRETTPGAVFLWENKTNLDGLDFGGGCCDWDGEDMKASRGFKIADAPLDSLEAPRIAEVSVVHRRDGVELCEGVHEWYRFPGVQSDTWRAQADRDGEVLALYGTALGLDLYAAGNVARRIAAGKVVAGIIPFGQDDGSVHSERALRRSRD